MCAGIWLCFAKKHSGRPPVTPPEAIGGGDLFWLDRWANPRTDDRLYLLRYGPLGPSRTAVGTRPTVGPPSVTMFREGRKITQAADQLMTPVQAVNRMTMPKAIRYQANTLMSWLLM